MINKIFAIFAVLALPSLAFAQNSISIGSQGVAGAVNEILGYVIPIIFALVLAFFFWNLAQYIFSEKDRDNAGKNMAISFGIIFVMVSIAGIVALLQNSVTFEDDDIRVPSFDVGGTIQQ